LLACMAEKLKDEWVTAYRVRSKCDRGGLYTREVLEQSARIGLIEKRKVIMRKTLYRIDPIDGEPVCPLEPNIPYEESVCQIVDEIVENCAQAKYEGQYEKMVYCDLLNYVKEELIA